MKDILLTNCNFIKNLTSISNNLNDNILKSAIREVQGISYREVIGETLYYKLIELVETGDIEKEENVNYKNLLGESQYFMAYSVLSQVVLTANVRIDNIGTTKLRDENVDSYDLSDTLHIMNIYQKKADYYKGLLQKWIKERITDYPELFVEKGNLNSSESCGIYLGGERGMRTLDVQDAIRRRRYVL